MIKFQGKMVAVDFTFESLCRMQEQYGLNVFEDAAWRAAPRTLAILIWGGLLHAEPALTLEAVQKDIKMAEYNVLARKVYQALGDTLPKKAQADEVVPS